MRPETVESFCDLMAWLAMREFGESAEAARVRGMHESNSQFAELVKAYEIYDLFEYECLFKPRDDRQRNAVEETHQALLGIHLR